MDRRRHARRTRACHAAQRTVPDFTRSGGGRVRRGAPLPVTRRGWTLLESLVAMILLAVVTAFVAGSMSRAQRSGREAAEARVLRAELRDAASVLGAELRAVSALDTVRLAADTAVEFFTPILVAIVCAESEGVRLLLAPIPGRLPAESVNPDTGDRLWVWREDTVLPPGRWLRRRIASHAAGSPGMCDGFTAAAPREVQLAESAGRMGAGTPAIVVRSGRYSIYRSSDAAWYLGYRRCDAEGASRCQAVQPVAGPYGPRVNGSAGIEFRFFDSAGEPLQAGAGHPWRVDMVVRPETTGALRRPLRSALLSDSTALSVAVRNAY